MTDTVTESATADDQAEPSLESAAVEQKLIEQLVAQARSKGLQLTGEGGLLQQLTKTVPHASIRCRWLTADICGATVWQRAGERKGCM
ncbi:hypothetical protein [Streptomyces sp. SAS_272]|uniref:hypothetical protein n=1 Tax=Streptomyces sp. SAS_272 TaxID=3412747 RepID=UPI00403CBEDE